MTLQKQISAPIAPLRDALLPTALDPVAMEAIASLGGASASDEEALGGPGREELDIDDIFSRHFSDPLEDFVADLIANGDAPKALTPERLRSSPAALSTELLASGTDAETGNRYEIRAVGTDVIALCDDGEALSIAGLYHGCQLTVFSNHEGRGLGTALAAWKFLFYGGFPCWDLDEASYSHGGLAAHRSAYDALAGIFERQADSA